jgi:hypothetical protein
MATESSLDQRQSVRVWANLNLDASWVVNEDGWILSGAERLGLGAIDYLQYPASSTQHAHLISEWLCDNLFHAMQIRDRLA